MTLDPPDASLDAFWKNQVALSVLGPEGHSVSFAVHLEGRDGSEIFSERVGTPMELPVAPETWSKRFAKFLKCEDCAWSFIEAASGRLVINGETLGEAFLRFEHEMQALRWVLRHEHGNIILRLVDETGQEGEGPEAVFYSMQRPLRGAICAQEAHRFGLVVPSPGGLFHASRGQNADVVVVSTGLTADGLQGLGVSPVVDEISPGTVTLADACKVLALWWKARLAGFLADGRCQQVKDRIAVAIFRKICGAKWTADELTYRQNPNSPVANVNLKRAVDGLPGFAAVLHRDHAALDKDFGQASSWYAELAYRYNVCSDPVLCSFALRLASAPHRLPDTFGAKLDSLLDQVVSQPTILRGARLLAVLCAQQRSVDSAALLPRWEW